MKRFLALAVLLLVLPAMAAAALPIDVRLTSCRDLLCVNSSDFFLPGEGAYIDYNSSVKEISYWAQITFPDGTKYQITFPNRITSNVTGNYTVEVIFWKDGYEETSLTKVVHFVDTLPGQQAQNPPVLDWAAFLLSMIAGVLTVLVVWRVYAHMKRLKPAPEKKEDVRKKSGKKR
jgi:hypothetical protein